MIPRSAAFGVAPDAQASRFLRSPPWRGGEAQLDSFLWEVPLSSRPWIAWYPADYRAKTGHLSFEQSEAYRRLLEAYYNRQGRLVNDRPSLYRICGAMTDSERAAVDHAADQFFTIQNGYLVNGRANEEIQICEENRKRLSAAGHRGGLIAGKGRPKKTIGLEQARSPSPSPSPSHSPSPSPSRSKKDRSLRSLLLNDIEREFNAFWEVYPRKVGKGQARRAYKGARKKAPQETLVTTAKAYAVAVRGNGKEPEFICHPSTWLNGERWLDEAVKTQSDLIDEAQARAAKEVFGDAEHDGTTEPSEG